MKTSGHYHQMQGTIKCKESDRFYIGMCSEIR